MAEPDQGLHQGVLMVDGREVEVAMEDLQVIQELGRGTYGVVEKMLHVPTGIVMAVKRATLTELTHEERRRVMDLDASMRTSDCPNTVQYYGALFREDNMWICMEVMDTSMDKFYQKVFSQGKTFPESILGKIAFSVVSALHYLQRRLHVIHQDVMPSKILINRQGDIKMCDFGIPGYLFEPTAVSINTGCKPYMAPERIIPESSNLNCNVKSDVWSLGITMVELSTGRFPYQSFDSPFEQLRHVIQDDPPRLPTGQFSPEYENFINACLQKQPAKRPLYPELLQMPFLERQSSNSTEVSRFIADILDASDNEVPA